MYKLLTIAQNPQDFELLIAKLRVQIEKCKREEKI